MTTSNALTGRESQAKHKRPIHYYAKFMDCTRNRDTNATQPPGEAEHHVTVSYPAEQPTDPRAVWEARLVDDLGRMGAVVPLGRYEVTTNPNDENMLRDEAKGTPSDHLVGQWSHGNVSQRMGRAWTQRLRHLGLTVAQPAETDPSYDFMVTRGGEVLHVSPGMGSSYMAGRHVSTGTIPDDDVNALRIAIKSIAPGIRSFWSAPTGARWMGHLPPEPPAVPHIYAGQAILNAELRKRLTQFERICSDRGTIPRALMVTVHDLAERLYKRADTISAVVSGEGLLSITAVFKHDIRLYVEVERDGSAGAVISRSRTHADDLHVTAVSELTEELVLAAIGSPGT